MIEIVYPETVGLSEERLSRVTEWLEQQITSERLAGASALIARRGQVAYFETRGVADINTGAEFAKDSIVRIYSMTKPVTSVAAMMMYEEGCFQLDDPVSKYIPEFTETRVWAGGDADVGITVPVETPLNIRHLMSHTSGLTYGFMQSNVVDAQYRKEKINFPSDASDLAAWVERLAGIPLICQPGSQWNYSVSTDVLGRLLEIWSGKNLEAFFYLLVFKRTLAVFVFRCRFCLALLHERRLTFRRAA